MAKDSTLEREVKIETALTQTPEAIPDGMHPQQFLKDEDLVGFYERQVKAAKPDDKNLPDLVRALGQARRGAAAVAANQADQAAMDEVVAGLVAGGMTEAAALAAVQPAAEAAEESENG